MHLKQKMSTLSIFIYLARKGNGIMNETKKSRQTCFEKVMYLLYTNYCVHTFIFIRRKHFRKNNLKCQSQSYKFSFLSTPLNLKRIKYFLDVKSLLSYEFPSSWSTVVQSQEEYCAEIWNITIMFLSQ